MDNTTQNQTTDTRDEQALIDIFYLDSYRLNSLISQLNNGALQAVTTTTENSQGSILSTKGSIGFQGFVNLGSDDNTSEGIKRSIQMTKTPLHDEVIVFLNRLGLSPTSNFSQNVFSSLQVKEGVISLKNYKMFAEVIPTIGDMASLFDKDVKEKQTIEREISLLKSKSDKSKEEKERLKELRDHLPKLQSKIDEMDVVYKNIHSLIPFLPKGIGLEIRLDDDSLLTGNLKSEYLIDMEESIFLNYGEYLPDRWKILGVVDHKNDITPIESDNILGHLSTMMKGLTTMLSPSESAGTIIPILIYRQLNPE